MIENLISDYQTKVDVLGKAKQDRDLAYTKMSNYVSNIIRIMAIVEQKYSAKLTPILYYVGYIENIKIRKETKVVFVRYSSNSKCGTAYCKVKIPMSYFSMTTEQIKSSHTAYMDNELQKVEDAKQEQIRKDQEDKEKRDLELYNKLKIKFERND